ncbi:MAG: hypothetical protein COA96_14170 [SAR86 cluster bacterium]|uniref:Uncharacterized protein n=1 Tax=SAR86 cluster bacterium TaxID=2030880 RepID=A0A2A5ATU3_9GAMM|nr:MAG: hypothetical protein COA96_14170 [SAR86 cluster bacterium]
MGQGEIVGILDSESKSVTNAPNVGAQSSGAPVVSINSTPYKSNADTIINIVQTDHGLIEEGFSIIKSISQDVGLLGSEVIDSNTKAVEAAIFSNESSVRKTLDFLEGALSGAANLVRDSIRESTYIAERSLDTVDDAIQSNRDIARDALYTAGSVVNLTEKINKQNTEFLDGALYEFRQSSQDVLSTLEAVDENRVAESTNQIAAITKLAAVVNTGGESLTTSINKVLGVTTIVVMGLVAWKAAS